MCRNRLWHVLTALFLTSLVMVTFNGCTSQDPMASGTVEQDVSLLSTAVQEEEFSTLYYVTRQGGYLVPVNSRLPETDRPIRVTLERLIAGVKAGEGLYAPIPAETRIRDLYIRDGTAYVDLSAEFVNKLPPGRKWAQWAVDTLVQTLTEFPEIERVQILIGGNVMEMITEGVPIGIPRERQPWLNPVSQELGKAKVVLYFDYQGRYLVPVSESVSDLSQSLSRTAVEELIKGPQGLVGLSPVMPDNVTLRNYRVEQRTAYVDLELGKEKLGSGTWNETRALQALGYTLIEFPHIDRVQVLVEGRIMGTVGTVGEGGDLSSSQLQVPLINLVE